MTNRQTLGSEDGSHLEHILAIACSQDKQGHIRVGPVLKVTSECLQCHAQECEVRKATKSVSGAAAKQTNTQQAQAGSRRSPTDRLTQWGSPAHQQSSHFAQHMGAGTRYSQEETVDGSGSHCLKGSPARQSPGGPPHWCARCRPWLPCWQPEGTPPWPCLRWGSCQQLARAQAHEGGLHNMQACTCLHRASCQHVVGWRWQKQRVHKLTACGRPAQQDLHSRTQSTELWPSLRELD